MNRKKFLKFRCTSLEKALIKKKAANTGLSMSEFSRAAALGQKISSKFTPEELEVYQMLLKYHQNFTALTNLFKAKNPSLSNETKVLADEIKTILQKIK